MPETLEKIFIKFEGNKNTLLNKEINANKEFKLRTKFIDEIKQPLSEFKFDKVEKFEDNKETRATLQKYIAKTYIPAIQPENIEIKNLQPGKLIVEYYVIGIPYEPNRKRGLTGNNRAISLNQINNEAVKKLMNINASAKTLANQYKNVTIVQQKFKELMNKRSVENKNKALEELKKVVTDTKLGVETKAGRAAQGFKAGPLIKRLSNKVKIARNLNMTVNSYENAIKSRNMNKIKEQNAKIDGDIRTYLRNVAAGKINRITGVSSRERGGNGAIIYTKKSLNNLNRNLLNKYKNIPEIKKYLNSFGNKQEALIKANKLITELKINIPGINKARKAINTATSSNQVKKEFDNFTKLYKTFIMTKMGLNGNFSINKVIEKSKTDEPTSDLKQLLEKVKAFGNGKADSTKLFDAQKAINQRSGAYKKLLKLLKLGNSNNWNATKAAAKKQSNKKEIEKLLGELKITRTPENQKEIVEFLEAFKIENLPLKNKKQFANLMNEKRTSRFKSNDNTRIAQMTQEKLSQKRNQNLITQLNNARNVLRKLGSISATNNADILNQVYEKHIKPSGTAFESTPPKWFASYEKLERHVKRNGLARKKLNSIKLEKVKSNQILKNKIHKAKSIAEINKILQSQPQPPNNNFISNEMERKENEARKIFNSFKNNFNGKQLNTLEKKDFNPLLKKYRANKTGNNSTKFIELMKLKKYVEARKSKPNTITENNVRAAEEAGARERESMKKNSVLMYEPESNSPAPAPAPAPANENQARKKAVVAERKMAKAKANAKKKAEAEEKKKAAAEERTRAKAETNAKKKAEAEERKGVVAKERARRDNIKANREAATKTAINELKETRKATRNNALQKELTEAIEKARKTREGINLTGVKTKRNIARKLMEFNKKAANARKAREAENARKAKEAKEIERRAKLQKAIIKGKNYLNSNKSNFENEKLTEASKNETKTNKMMERIENAKKRRALFNKVFGTGNKPIGSFNVTKAPNLAEYEKAISDSKYKTEQNQLKEAIKKQAINATNGVKFTRAIGLLNMGSQERKNIIKEHLKTKTKISNVQSLQKAFLERLEKGTLSLDDKKKLEKSGYKINSDFPKLLIPPKGQYNLRPLTTIPQGPRGRVEQGIPTKRPLSLNFADGYQSNSSTPPTVPEDPAASMKGDAFTRAQAKQRFEKQRQNLERSRS